MAKLNNNSICDPIKVLNFWHSIEFFTPFDLNEVHSRLNEKYTFTESQLIENGNSHLPWISGKWGNGIYGQKVLHKVSDVPAGEYRYNLYLLPFKKNELTKICQEVFPRDREGIANFVFEEKFDDEGETCFAQLPLDCEGRPAWDKMSISTLPWALGKLVDKKMCALNHKCYKEEQQKFEVEINSLSSHINNIESSLIKDHVSPGILTAHGLEALFILLKHWAHFSPNHPSAIVIERIKITQKSIKGNFSEQVKNELNNQTVINIFQDGPTKNTPGLNKKGSLEKEESTKETSNVDLNEHGSILNSFYIEDLEKVINDIVKKKHNLLSHYILGINKDKKIDLHAEKNHSYIIEKLQPCYINHGRWPVDDKHFMSLMQQFVINQFFHPTDDHLLLSVNGPPGTGKTTLLQDIVAENITRRARVLSEFASSEDVFTDSISINFTNRDSISMNLLNKKLLGFEMIVVSSNNTAVENISKEFPLKRKISDKYQEKLNYLRPVASKVFSLHKNNEIIPLQPEDKPWGLISIALGNSKNCNQFNNRVFFAPEDRERAEFRRKEGETLSIWEWRKQYNGATFQQAKQDFIEADKALHNYLNSIKRLEQLHKEIGGIDVDSYCQDYHSTIELIELTKDRLEVHRNELIRDSTRIKQEKLKVSNNLRQHLQFKPNFYQRIFHRAIAKAYRDQLNRIRMDWNTLLDKERVLKEEKNLINFQLKEVFAEKDKIYELIKTKENEYKKLRDEYYDLLNLLQEIIIPSHNVGIENVTQLQPFWQNEKLNELRANLFILALKLHEAWLAEVLKNNKFTGNLFAISKLLSNKRLVNPENEIYIWQSLFMWVPVISSTFASVARLFKNVGSQTLGYFLIDEAGQAIPQAAIGAIWRAKQVLIVGDPMQIEPVFTTPPSLIEGLAEHILQKNYEQWLPTLTSVQILADNANFLGAYTNIADNNQWIGCPLRVHRRCLDPMFSVANRIAYGNKMINARSNNDVLAENYYLGNSCWYNLKGKAIDKQYVLDEGELLLKLFVKLYELEQKLPNLYIITPFKQIKKNLQKLIEDSNNWSRYLTTTRKIINNQILKIWCSQNIGTVHTFQGKEAESVIFVLGADEKTLGAINWASDKPNLLNVALTRAKDRIYVIGNYELWSNKRYFSELSPFLPLINL